MRLAIADFTEAIRLDPENALAYYCRGQAYLAKNDYDSAIADYTDMIRLDPKYALAYRERGRAHSSKGDNDRAIADYTEAIRIYRVLSASVHFLLSAASTGT